MTEVTAERGISTPHQQEHSAKHPSQDKKTWLSRVHDTISKVFPFLDRKGKSPATTQEQSENRVSRRELSRELLRHIAEGAKDVQQEFARGLHEEGTRTVDQMIADAQNPYGEAELKADIQKRDRLLKRRTFLQLLAGLGASITLPTLGAGTYAADRIVRYKDETRSYFPNGESIIAVENALTVVPRPSDNEWVVAEAPRMLVINTETGKVLMPDDPTNSFPGIGYEKVVATTSPGEAIAAVQQSVSETMQQQDARIKDIIRAGLEAAKKEARDLPGAGDQIDIVYIDKTTLQQTVRAKTGISVEETNLSTDTALVTYLMDEKEKLIGGYSKKPDHYSFQSLQVIARELGVTLDSKESLRAFLQGMPELKDQLETLDRIAGFLYSSPDHIVCINNIGSLKRHIVDNKQSSAPLPGVPLLLKEVIEEAPLYKDVIEKITEPPPTE